MRGARGSAMPFHTPRRPSSRISGCVGRRLVGEQRGADGTNLDPTSSSRLASAACTTAG